MTTSGSTTTNYEFYKPDPNSDGWGVAMNTFIETVDVKLFEFATFKSVATAGLIDAVARANTAQANLEAHLADTTAAHAASAIGESRVGSAQLALDDLNGRLNTAEASLLTKLSVVARNGTLTGAGTSASPLAVSPTLIQAIDDKLDVVTRQDSLIGDGTPASPLGVNPATTNALDARLDVVEGVVAGIPAITNALDARLDTVEGALPGKLSAVSHDASLSGQGTPASPLAVNWANAPAQGGGGSGVTTTTTSSSTWTIPNEGVIPRTAYCAVPAPVGVLSVPLSYSGLQQTPYAQTVDTRTGLLGSAVSVMAPMGEDSPALRPTNTVTVTWAVFGAGGNGGGGATPPPASTTVMRPVTAAERRYGTTFTDGTPPNEQVAAGLTDPYGPMNWLNSDAGAVDYTFSFLYLTFAIPAGTLQTVKLLVDGVTHSGGPIVSPQTALVAWSLSGPGGAAVGTLPANQGTRDNFGNLTPSSALSIPINTTGMTPGQSYVLKITPANIESAAGGLSANLVNPRLEVTYT